MSLARIALRSRGVSVSLARPAVRLAAGSPRLYSSANPEPSTPPPSSSKAPLFIGGGLVAAGLCFWTLSAQGTPLPQTVGATAGSAAPTAGAVVAPAEVIPAPPTEPIKVPISASYEAMVDYVKNLQTTITTAIDELEASASATPAPTASSWLDSFSRGRPAAHKTPASFVHDSWVRPNDGGEGISCVISDGRVLEKGGVNISIVHGLLPPRAVAQMKTDHSVLGTVDPQAHLPYSACGISIVLHPHNPKAPTVHMNCRYFEVYDPRDLTKPLAYWYGGGSDLTPSYLFPEDAVHFHSTVKAACDASGEGYYPAFKQWCDKYFYIPHRKEARGVGGIFFDDLDHLSVIHASANPKFVNGLQSPTQEDVFKIIRDVGDAFLPSYLPILQKRHALSYSDENKRWQQLRRGRYVEFNLVNDRGTKFGLMTPGARIESVLMSLPTTARWEYCTPMGAPGTEEGKLMEVLRKPIAWV